MNRYYALSIKCYNNTINEIEEGIYPNKKFFKKRLHKIVRKKIKKFLKNYWQSKQKMI